MTTTKTMTAALEDLEVGPQVVDPEVVDLQALTRGHVTQGSRWIIHLRNNLHALEKENNVLWGDSGPPNV